MDDQVQSEEPRQPDNWVLVALFEVDRREAVQCDCKGCGQVVFKQVHLVERNTGEIECWGKHCYRRELLGSSPKRAPLYTGMNGRRLTPDERLMLLENRRALIEKFRADREQELHDERRRANEIAASRQTELDDGIERVATEHAAQIAIRGLKRTKAAPIVPEYLEVLDSAILNDPLYQRAVERTTENFKATAMDLSLKWVRSSFQENVAALFQKLKRLQ